jgi:hypothetical protein
MIALFVRSGFLGSQIKQEAHGQKESPGQNIGGAAGQHKSSHSRKRGVDDYRQTKPKNEDSDSYFHIKRT